MASQSVSFTASAHGKRTSRKEESAAARLWKALNAGSARDSVPKGEITFLIRNLATLVDSGVSLAKSLTTLSEEQALGRSRPVLIDLHRRLESGASFSAALAAHPSCFDRVTINQIRVGERSGTLAGTLQHIAEHREKAGKLRSEIGKKLAYPAMLTLVGTCVITFLLGYVVPVFEETYSNAKVPLPGVTKTLIAVGDAAQSYGLYVLLVIVLLAIGLQQLRKRDSVALAIDRQMLRLPLVGAWLRDIAVLELMDILSNLMSSGYTLAESLSDARQTVSNRAMQLCVKDLHRDVEEGERFSRSVEHHNELFPPMISQLVIVGERTGNLLNAARHIQRHLEVEVERKTSILVGVIEPVLTISLAAAVAVILLAIYLPMFDMINTVGG